MEMKEAVRTVVAGHGLSAAEAHDAFGHIMDGRATDAQIAAFMVGLRMKGETVDEITGAARAMREHATPVTPASIERLVDTCGTGGDESGTFNISTAAALVAAGAGARVAKHGNRAVSSGSGSADVLEALGVRITVGPEVMKRCIDELGLCFLFAQTLHKAMKYAAGPRKEIGVRTLFNILGPLTNPASAPAQVLGVYAPQLTEMIAQVLRNLGSRKAFVVHGEDRLDEVTLSAPTKVTELSGGAIRTYTIKPGDLGLDAAEREAMRGGTPQENAKIIEDLLRGAKGPRRDIVLANAAFAITAAELAPTPRDAVALAAESIDTGAALAKLEGLRRLTAA